MNLRFKKCGFRKKIKKKTQLGIFCRQLFRRNQMLHQARLIKFVNFTRVNVDMTNFLLTFYNQAFLSKDFLVHA